MKASAIVTVASNVLVPYILLALGWQAFSFLQANNWLHYAAFAVLAWIVLWNATPHYLVWKRKDMPTALKRKASLSFLESALRGAVVMPFSMSAFFVVPIVLLFVKEKDNKLPGIFDLLYGDVNGIHGDSVFWVWNPEIGEEIRIELPQTLDIETEQRNRFIEVNYFLEGVWQRTWASRVVWLLRNRSTKLSEKMGVRIANYREWKYWGPLKPIDRLATGSYVMQMGKHFEVYQIVSLGKWFGKFPMICRQRYGYKLGNQMGPFITTHEMARKTSSEVINIAYTIKGDKGPSSKPFPLNPLVENEDGSVSLALDLIDQKTGRPL